MEDLTHTCSFAVHNPKDPCPYIWKRFSSANFVTAFIEDAPWLAIFNYDMGFGNATNI